MKIEKTNEEVTSSVRNVVFTFLLTNNKDEKKEITARYYVTDSEMQGYDNEITYFDEDDEEIESIDDYVQNFMGDDEDVDDIMDELNDLIK